MTSSYPENSPDESRVGVSIRRLHGFSQTNSKSGDASIEEAFRFFHLMAQMEPRFSLHSFNLLLSGMSSRFTGTVQSSHYCWKSFKLIDRTSLLTAGCQDMV